MIMSTLSIRRRLLTSLITAIIVCWGVSVWFVYLAAHQEVEEIYDAGLAQQSRVLATLMSHEDSEESKNKQQLRQLVDELGPEVSKNSPLLQKLLKEYLGKSRNKDFLALISRDVVPGHRYESRIAFIVIDSTGRVLLRSNMPASFEDFTPGFNERKLGRRVWRTFGLIEPKSHLMVQVGEQLAVRKETVRYIVLNSLWPLFVALPLFGIVIWITVGGGLKPLKLVAQKVERRDPDSLVPISSEGVPHEVVPMVESLNRLFARLQSALDNERRFTADAAHELRTPLAALKTMAQAKRLSDHSGEHKLFLDQVVKGVDRTTHLLEQLLTLARMESQSMVMTDLQKVDIGEQVIQVLSHIGPQALERQIDLSFEGGEQKILVNGYAPALQILIRNLIDNAIRYTPTGGSVRLALNQRPDETALVIEDSGPGIPDSQKALVFQRFTRGEGVQSEGSGLGLSIVRRIIELHHAGISLDNLQDSMGLRVTVTFENRASI
jgi:two-component system, OmpR family, sensor histidine kinase QseC